MTFIIDIFQFHCKIEHKQVKCNKIKEDMCKSKYYGISMTLEI